MKNTQKRIKTDGNKHKKVCTREERKMGGGKEEWTYLTLGTVISCLNVSMTVVASVDEAVIALCVELIQERHSRELGSTKGRELPVFFSGQVKESITPVHEVTGNEGIGIGGGREG